MQLYPISKPLPIKINIFSNLLLFNFLVPNLKQFSKCCPYDTHLTCAISSSIGMAVPEFKNASLNILAGLTVSCPLLAISLVAALIDSFLRCLPPDMPSSCSALISMSVSQPPIRPRSSFRISRSKDWPALSCFNRN